MTNGNDAANPCIESVNHGGIIVEITTSEPGLTKREYFAANCPEVPDWFEHKKEPKAFNFPNWQTVQMEDDRELLKAWVRDGCFDLPEHLEWFQEKFNEAVKLRNEWEYRDKENRYFQWRTYYADALVKQLNS